MESKFYKTHHIEPQTLQLQPEGQIKDIQAQSNKHLQAAVLLSQSFHLPELHHNAENEKVRKLISSTVSFLFSPSLACPLLFSLLFLYLTLVLSLSGHLSFIYSLYSLFFLCFSFSNNRFINQKRRGAQSTRSQSIQTTSLPMNKKCDTQAQTCT